MNPNSTYIVNPVLVRMKESSRGSIYQSIVAIGMRSRQINDDIKMQLAAKMEHLDNDNEDTDTPNLDKLAVSREFDVLPKPTFMAMREIVDEKLTFHFPVE